MGLVLPQIFGVGYEAVEGALRGQLGPALLGVLVVAKIAATSLTLGAGGSGGIFAPSLFMGAMLGGAVGSLFHTFLPDLTAPSGAYALVGMAAVFAGAAQTSITSVLILFEMTGDYRIILPLLTAVVVSSLVAHLISRETIYTIKLQRRGIDLSKPPRPDPLAHIRVGDVMAREVVSVYEELPFRAILDHIRRHPFTSFPVTDGQNRLVGVLGYAELREVLVSERPEDTFCARELMRTPPPVTYPDVTLSEVTEQFQVTGVGRLPVVSREEPATLLGVISHSDVLAAYQQAVIGTPRQP